MHRPTPAPPDGDRIAGLFDRAAASYDRVGIDLFPAAGRLLVAHARIGAGEHVLDAGCGTGASLFPAARAAGPPGSVTGIDASPEMIERVRQQAAEEWPHPLRTYVGDLEDPDPEALRPPPGGYDAVLAGMVLSFLRRPDRTLRGFHSALRPGGRLALSWWGPEPPGWDGVVEATRPFGPGTPEEIERGVPGQRRPPTPESVRELALAAGFARVELYQERLAASFRDADHWWAWMWSTAARAFWESVPRDRLPAARAAAEDALAPLRAPDGTLPYVLTAHFAVCHR
ncbi:methyltransferase [Kitasatospora sp. NPDC048540]|uniref:class I SAM-dependent methyltransferase n=1 Tax=unclassified Kitasatospora TaxID=2633591 RepID=UPI00068F047C|nr:class I SAM-dependent methyltransferase [Kitasatospora sp. MBT63]